MVRLYDNLFLQLLNEIIFVENNLDFFPPYKSYLYLYFLQNTEQRFQPFYLLDNENYTYRY